MWTLLGELPPIQSRGGVTRRKRRLMEASGRKLEFSSREICDTTFEDLYRTVLAIQVARVTDVSIDGHEFSASTRDPAPMPRTFDSRQDHRPAPMPRTFDRRQDHCSRRSPDYYLKPSVLAFRSFALTRIIRNV